MTDNRVTYGDTVYCSVDDVRKLFRKEQAFGPDTNPSDTEVLDLIRERSDFLDRETRHAWRENTVTTEYESYKNHYRWDAGRPLMLNKMSVRTPLDSTQGDALEVWDGTDWHDWLTDSAKSEGRNGDYWLDEATGQLWIYDRFVWRSRPQLRVTYRYGEDPPTATDTVDGGNTSYTYIESPHDIKHAVAKLVAIDLISSDHYTNLIPGTDGGINPGQTVQQWREEIFGGQNQKGIIARHKVDPAWIDAY